MFAFGFLPQVVLFVGHMLVSDGALHYFNGHLDILWKVPVSVALLALFFATLGTAAAAITTRRVVAAVTFLGILLVSTILGHALSETQPGRHSLFGVLNLPAVPLYVRDLVFEGHIGRDELVGGIRGAGALAVLVYVAVVVVCLGVLAYRYRWIER